MSSNPPPKNPKPPKKLRLDQLVLDQGLAESRTQAQALILAGKILDPQGHPLTKAGQPVSPLLELQLKEKLHPWVSRGGMKLAEGIQHFGIRPQGQIIADIGASTGGFTDVLLHHGAAKVYAVDVGYGQLADKLRKDERVVVMEKTNARHLTSAEIPEPLDGIVCDASFISLKTVLPAVMGLVSSTLPIPVIPESDFLSKQSEQIENPDIRNPDDYTGSRIAPLVLHGKAMDSRASGMTSSGQMGKGWLLALIKPQFEVGREDVGNGIITDPALHQRVCNDIHHWLQETMGWQVRGITPSPILGPKGNKEFLIYATK